MIATADTVTLLTIYTPTYKRPAALARCRASVAAQTDADYQHLVIEDGVGLGVAGMFATIPAHHAQIAGAYVYFLSDDDWLADNDVVRDVRAALDAHGAPDVLMARATIAGSVFPSDLCWQAPPQCGHVTLSNWVVRRKVWTSVPYGHRYEGDFDFIAACWERGYRFAWLDRVICRAAGWGGGRPE